MLQEKHTHSDFLTVPVSSLFLFDRKHYLFLNGKRSTLRYFGSEIPVIIFAVLLALVALFFLWVGVVDPNVRLGAILVAAIFGLLTMWVAVDMRRHYRLIHDGQVIQGEIIESIGNWGYRYHEYVGIPGLKRAWFIRYRYRFYTPFGGAIEKRGALIYDQPPDWSLDVGRPIAVIYVNDNFHRLL